MRPLITALIDTYNHEKYIEQALVSVLEQGLPEAESRSCCRLKSGGKPPHSKRVRGERARDGSYTK
jgi:hypothetical protein